MTRELDWRIHELMGNDLTGWEWYVEDENSRYSHYICIREMQVWGQKVAVTRKFIPHYSSTWEGFGLMVEWLQERDIYFGVSLSLFHHGWYGAVVNINRLNETTYDPSAPQALAKAFIAAMEERMSNWCEMHNHVKNACPWCEISELEHQLESVQRERDEARQQRDAYYENAKYTEAAFHEVTKLRAEVESLQRDKAELIEVLEWYGGAENNDWDIDSFGEITQSKVMKDDGLKARTILSRMKGETT